MLEYGTLAYVIIRVFTLVFALLICIHFQIAGVISLLPNTRIFGYSDKETQPHSLNINS